MTVPTAKMRSGDFSVLLAVACLALAGPEGWMTFQISDVHAPVPSTPATNAPANK